MAKYVMALDQGTTSSRAIIFDKTGKIVTKSQREFEQIYPHAGWVEHNPMDILFSEYQSISTILGEGLINPKDIACIGVTNQRETTILWNKETGQPVYNAIVWQCRRTAEYAEQLKAQGLEAEIKEKTGLVIDAYFSATKIRWILDNIPEAQALADEGKLLFGTVETWLIWNLSGGAVHPESAVHVTDYSNASRTMLFNINTLQWDEEICNKLGIPMSILPTPVPSSKVYGLVAPGIQGLETLEGIPISGAIGDQPGALFGQNCFKPGMVKSTYGTGVFLLMNTGSKRVDSKNNLTSGIVWGIGDEVTYGLEGSAFIAGAAIQWLRDGLQLIDKAPRCDELAETVEDSNGIYLVPAFAGLGAPYWDMYARGILVGLTRGVTRAHLCRALEGFALGQAADERRVVAVAGARRVHLRHGVHAHRLRQALAGVELRALAAGLQHDQLQLRVVVKRLADGLVEVLLAGDHPDLGPAGHEDAAILVHLAHHVHRLRIAQHFQPHVRVEGDLRAVLAKQVHRL